MELYSNYLLNMGMQQSDLARSYTADEGPGNVMGELMNQVVGDFTGKVHRELHTHITQNQPKMLVLNKQVMLSGRQPRSARGPARHLLYRVQQHLLSGAGHRQDRVCQAL